MAGTKKLEWDEFERRFLAARLEHLQAGRGASPKAPAHVAALQFIQKHKIPCAEHLLESSLLDAKRERSAAKALLVPLEAQCPAEIKWLYWVLLGTINLNEERFTDAEAALNKALAVRGDDSPQLILNGLGVVYIATENFDKAIEVLKLAASDPTNTLPSRSLNNLGIAYSRKGLFHEAIEILEKALADPGNLWPGYTLNSLGLAYRAIGDFDKAIGSFQGALAVPGYDTPSLSLLNMGSTLYLAGREKEAKEAFTAALEAPDLTVALQSQVLANLELLESYLPPTALSQDDRALIERGSEAIRERGPEQRMILKLESARQSQYERYLEKASSTRVSVLSVLRGWSSAVTLLEGSSGAWRGGGYILKWREIGIVIDPGFDFIANLHDAGYHGREISAVLVSHNHPDHNADLGRLDDLRYELYKRRSSDPNGGISPYVLMWDFDSQAAITFNSERPEHQHRPFTFDLGRCRPTDTISRPHNLPFSVTYFEVRHGALQNAVAFTIDLHDDHNGSDFRIGYSGDTEYFPELPNLLSGCDVLIAHISQPDAGELTDPNVRKKHHLGYRGTAELIRDAGPKLALVGEFWAGLADLRLDLVNGIRKIAGTDAVLPAGLGLHLSLPSLEIECSQCAAAIAFQQITVAPPPNAFGDLAYLCPDCVLR